MSASPATSRTPRFRTIYVDPDALNRAASPTDDARSMHTGLKLIGVDEQVAHVRKNVRDAAQAILTWVAGVMDQEDGELNSILDQCLRPGPDSERINYAALAKRVNTFTGCNLSAKRVRTAILNLRRVHGEAVVREVTHTGDTPPDGLAPLRNRLIANLVGLTGDDNDKLARAIGTELLTAVRHCAGRLIDKPYGEGIPRSMDAASLEGRLLRFVRDTLHEKETHLHTDLQRLIQVLDRADQSAESDTAVVVSGARGVCDLLGADSLPGLLAQMNVIVVGRDLLGTELYLAELGRIAEAAAAWHDDAETTRYLNWARRLPVDCRVPTPMRVASFARNNLATHLLQRIITDELDAATYLPQAAAAIEAMRRTDGSFRLLPVTEAIHATALATAGIDEHAVLELFRTMDTDAAATLLSDLSNFDSNRQVVRAVRDHAIRALPQLRYRFIAV